MNSEMFDLYVTTQLVPTLRAGDVVIPPQRISLAQIMGLSRHQAEVDKVAERIGHSQYLRRYAPARTSDGLE